MDSISNSGARTIYWYNITLLEATPSWMNWSDICFIGVDQQGAFLPTSSFISVYVVSETGGTFTYERGQWVLHFGPQTSDLMLGGDMLVLELSQPATGDRLVLQYTPPFGGEDPLLL